MEFRKNKRVYPMRPKERIPEVLKEIEKIWEKRPDLRLGQLILNLHMDKFYLYSVEDDKLIEKLKELYGKFDKLEEEKKKL